MPLVRILLIASLCVGLSPGISELISDAAHLVLEGHWAHDESHPGHDEPGPEHGCTGWHHTCPCHSSVSFIASAPLVVPYAIGEGIAFRQSAVGAGPSGVASSLDHPPRA